MFKRVAILTGLLVLLALSACDGLPGQTQASDTLPDTASSPTATLSAGETSPAPTSADLTTLTPSPQPTEPPRISFWPLAADLFYLNDAGQVWHQPLAGDADAAATITRLDLAVRDFAVAPGDDWLLYRTDAFVALTSLNGLGGQLIDENPGMPTQPGLGHTLCWSPDASKLAYTTDFGFRVQVPGGGQSYGPLIFDSFEDQPVVDIRWSRDSGWLAVWRADGSLSLYGSRSEGMVQWIVLSPLNTYTWLSDGRLAYAPVEGGLALVTPGDADSRVFIMTQDRQVTLLTQRPDGALAFFAHTGSIDDPGFLHLGNPQDLSFRQESTTPIHTSDLVWDPSGMRLIGPDVSAPATLVALDPVSGARATAESCGVPLNLAWGTLPSPSVSGMPLPADLYFIAPQNNVQQVWRLPKDGEPPEPITAALLDVLDFDISADGSQIAYTSGGIVYQQNTDSPDVAEMVTLADTSRLPGGAPAFSPDGEQLAYANDGIWVLDLKTGDRRRLVADQVPRTPDDLQVQLHDQPRWSPDGQWLLITVRYYEGYDYALLSVRGTPQRLLLLNLYNARAEWAADGQLMVYSEGNPFGEPMLSLVTPEAEPVVTRLLDLPILDVGLDSQDRLALLRASSSLALGPTSVRLYTAAPDGSDLRIASEAMLLESPVLSPGAIMLAGLLDARLDEFGVFSGNLAVAVPATGEIFTIEGMSGAYDLMWVP